MTDSSTAFNTYLKKIDAIEKKAIADIDKYPEPKTVFHSDFKDNPESFLPVAVEQSKASEIFHKNKKEVKAELKQKQDEALKEFKDILFGEYSEYSTASLEKVFDRIEDEYDCYNWLIAFKEEMEFLSNFNELNKI